MHLAIRSQIHEMWAEGSSDVKPTKNEIEKEVMECGYRADNIDIFYDEMMEVWLFTSDISELI